MSMNVALLAACSKPLAFALTMTGLILVNALSLFVISSSHRKDALKSLCCRLEAAPIGAVVI